MAVIREYNQEANELIIKISGDLDFSMLDQFRQTYNDLDLDQVRIKIDLSETGHFNSEALGMLLILREHAGGDASSISIIGCGDDMRQIFKASSFDGLFDMSC